MQPLDEPIDILITTGHKDPPIEYQDKNKELLENDIIIVDVLIISPAWLGKEFDQSKNIGELLEQSQNIPNNIISSTPESISAFPMPLTVPLPIVDPRYDLRKQDHQVPKENRIIRKQIKVYIAYFEQKLENKKIKRITKNIYISVILGPLSTLVQVFRFRNLIKK
jgi:hypothetical protein